MLPVYVVSKLKSLIGASDERLPKLFSALGDPGRFRIVTLLLKRYEDICVSDIARILGITVPAASQQLKVLERSGIVRRIRTGQMICYEVRRDDSVVRTILPLFSDRRQVTS